MNRIYFYLTSVVLILLTGLCVTRCGESDSGGKSEELSVKQFFPTKVIEGQEVQITGTGFNEVTSVVFPGNRSVTSFKKTGNGLISVITPSGVSDGILSVQAGDNTASAGIQLTVGNPHINSMMPNDSAGIGRELNISGVDMEFYIKAIFPGIEGDIVVNAIDFTRKSTDFVFVKVPDGIEDGPTRIKLVTVSGREDFTPQIVLIGAPDDTNEDNDVVVWEGEHDLRGWGNNWEIKAQWFRDAGLDMKARDIVKLHFEPYNSWYQFKFNDGNWGILALPETEGESDPAVVTSSGKLKDVDGVFQFQISDELVYWFTRAGATSNAIIINGEGLTFTKISVAVAK